MGRVWSRTPEAVLDHGLKISKNGIIDGEVPFEVSTHLAFHLVDLAKVEHALGDDQPGLVAVGIVAHDF